MRITTLTIFILCFVACKSDVPVEPVETDQLVGKWDVFFVSRNGKETKTTENAYFEFQADNQIKSNLFPDEFSRTFQLDNDKISIDSTELLKFLEIDNLANDTLILDTKIKSFEMQFKLKRQR